MNVWIVGASVRAAAFSTLRAGAVPLCADLFADRDLAAVASCRRIAPERFAQARFESEFDAPADAWFYTGAIENHPSVVDRIAERLPLLGISGLSLREVRDPFRLRKVLETEGFRAPENRRDAPESNSSRWLRKPFASAGGRSIAFSDEPREEDAREHYFQRFVEGVSVSAVFIGYGGGAAFQGATLQMLGDPGAPFVYRGSLGPWPLASKCRNRIVELGDCLSRHFRMNGLFGVDLILQDEEPWTIEVNPRYTASVEVLELAGGVSLLRGAFDSFQDSVESVEDRSTNSRFVAKEILFAETSLRFDGYELPIRDRFDPFAIPTLADVPENGSSFVRGEPVATIFGRGDSIEECHLDLERSRIALKVHLKSQPDPLDRASSG